jgi:hypothetical protein
MTSRSERHRNPPQPKPKATVEQILAKAADMLNMTEQALEDLNGSDPRRRLPGLRNIAVWGRSITNVVEKLKTPLGDETFSGWYTPYREEMEGDELLKYFYQWRSKILKEGETPATTTTSYIGYLDSAGIARLNQNAPPGTTATFIGDQLGGSGWIVSLPDGTEEKVYFELPDDMNITINLHAADPPRSHAGERLENPTLGDLAERYVAYLRRLVNDAHATFSGKPSV